MTAHTGALNLKEKEGRREGGRRDYQTCNSLLFSSSDVGGFMSANTSSVPCFSLYNLDLQRNVRYTQPLSTTPSDGTDELYLRMTLLVAAIVLNQCTPSTIQETEQRLPLSLDTGDRTFITLNTLFISYSNIPRCTQ